jgi:hypothetical protein
LGAFDAIDAATGSVRTAVTVARIRGVEAGEAEGCQEKGRGQEGRQEEEGAGTSQGCEAQGDQEEGAGTS